MGAFWGVIVEVFVLWLALSVVAGVIAGAKGRSGFGYFLLSVFLTPLVGLILAIALPKHEPSIKHPGPGDIAAGARVPCPQCAEQIVATAKLCRFCGYQLAAPQAGAPESSGPSVAPAPGAYKAGRAVGGLFSSDKHRYPPND
jgi:hypothetical protein